MNILFLVVAALLGGFAAYKDTDAFFRQKKVELASILTHVPSLAFLSANALIAVALLAWALYSDPNSPINVVIHVESDWAKTIVVSLGVPVLLRSKLFAFGQGENRTSFGLEGVYDWFREKVLYDLHLYSVRIKQTLATQYGNRFAGKLDFPGKLRDYVLDALKPFRTEAEVQDLDKQFEVYQKRFSTELASTAHVEALVRWAMDNVGVAQIKRYLGELK